MDLPQRKPNRLKEYDYSRAGAYFITICTENRKNLFWTGHGTNAEKGREADSLPYGSIPEPFEDTGVGADIIRPNPSVDTPQSQYGKIVNDAIWAISEHYVGVTVDKYVIMPNHIHLILRLSDSAQTTVSTVIGQLKRAASKQIGHPVWQRSFYDHVIRGEADYREIWEYIENNPRKWAEDCFYTE